MVKPRVEVSEKQVLPAEMSPVTFKACTDSRLHSKALRETLEVLGKAVTGAGLPLQLKKEFQLLSSLQ